MLILVMKCKFCDQIPRFSNSRRISSWCLREVMTTMRVASICVPDLRRKQNRVCECVIRGAVCHLAMYSSVYERGKNIIRATIFRNENSKYIIKPPRECIVPDPFVVT
jgi:hypothetical protein